MRRFHRVAGVLTLGLILSQAGVAAAGTPSQRTTGQKSSGARTDITVPYLTSGKSTFMSGAVAPRIYASPTVVDPKEPGTRRVYNLPFYGGSQSFGSASNGAVSKPK